MDAILDEAVGTPAWGTIPIPPEMLQAVQARLDEIEADVAQRAAESLRQGVYLRLVALAHLFDLTAFDRDLIMVCLAPELDPRYERLYGYLHDDVTRRHPTVGLILDLLCPDLETKLAARSRLTTGSPLLQGHLLHLGEEPNQLSSSMLGKTVRLDPRIAHFLLDGDDMDDRLRTYARIVPPEAGLDDLVFPPAFLARLTRLADHVRTAGDDLVLFWQGPGGVGKKTAAAACCRVLGAPLLVLDGERLAATDVDEFATLVHVVDREARLQGAALYWEDFDALLGEEKKAHLAVSASATCTACNCARVTTRLRSVSKTTSSVSSSAGGAATLVPTGTSPSTGLPSARANVTGTRAGCAAVTLVPMRFRKARKFFWRPVDTFHHELGEAPEDPDQGQARVRRAVGRGSPTAVPLRELRGPLDQLTAVASVDRRGLHHVTPGRRGRRG